MLDATGGYGDGVGRSGSRTFPSTEQSAYWMELLQGLVGRDNRMGRLEMLAKRGHKGRRSLAQPWGVLGFVWDTGPQAGAGSAQATGLH